MSVVAAAIIPHSPLLLPGLSIEARKKVEHTTLAIQGLATELSAYQPDALFLVTAHTDTTILAPGYAFLQSPKLKYEFSHFGDLATYGTLRGAVGFTHRLKERLETRFPIPLVSNNILPYTFAIPMLCLGNILYKVPIICLQVPPTASYNELLQLGDMLGDNLHLSKRRVILLACGDLSHEKNFLDARIVYDKIFLTAWASNDISLLINLDEKLRNSVDECLWAPSVLVRAMLKDHSYTAKINSHESVAGVGLMVASIKLA